jgi:hypothetical protein
MYVESDELIEYWQKQIVPGRIFSVTYAEPKEIKYKDKSWTKFQLSRHKLFPVGSSKQGD